ncbi:hypothetical protein BDF20DRAFT_841796 [Mycotypha africana]|uniref:uncharacterized protein n=1 Tax=Mycotypha africana TaxID=64632 RepID=UPI0023005429|nr:uncharacterized protein BDF20DRAFT_841796 [Mycotypha africana]KAI8990945.1 hypothetical protein BDF20DRAFT_841796 [Mycotypha africana]
MTDSAVPSPSKPAHHRISKRIELDIVPGKSLGPFCLGSSLWDVIHFLSERSQLFPTVELQYSQEEPLKFDFIITLPVNGLHLRFDGSLQRLRSIECYDPNKVKLVYQHSEVSSSRTIPTFLLIYKSFGPTYPGEYEAKQSIYTLKYPGLAFTFPIPLRHQHLYKAANDTSNKTTTADLPLELPDGTTPIASKVIVYSSQCYTWQQSVIPASHLSKIIAESNVMSTSATLRSFIKNYGKVGRREVEKVIVKPTVGITLVFPTVGHSSTDSGVGVEHTESPTSILLSSLAAATLSPTTQQHSRQTSGTSTTQTINSISSNNHILQQFVHVDLNQTSVQDILVDLGKPSKIFYKEEDKMKIHSVKNMNDTMNTSTADKATANNRNSNGSKNDTIMDDNNINQLENSSSNNGNNNDVNNTSSSSNSISDDNQSYHTDYFLNYFHFGIDILIDGGSHVCKKIVLHGNIPGHYDFQRYKRCPFQLTFPKSIIKQFIKKEDRNTKKNQLVDILDDEDNDYLQYVITADMKVTDMKKRIPWDPVFAPTLTTADTSNSNKEAAESTTIIEQRPVILTRGSSEQNPFGSTHLTGYDEGIILEVMKNGYIPTVVLF